MSFLHYCVDTVFVMLGPKCNFSCKYCLQQPLMADGNEACSTQAHPDAANFLLDLAARQEGRLGIHFYGGEPFLYQKAMRGIVATLRGEPNVFFSAITNGSLIDRETAAWCNDAGMGVTVSWDGPGTVQTRGRDVFADAALRENLFRIRKLGVSGVVSACAYPLETVDAFACLDREYHALHGYNLSLNLDEIMDTGLADTRLLDVDAARVREDMETIAGEYENKLRGEPHNLWRANVGRAYVDMLRNNIRGAQSFARSVCACGNGTTTLNMDMQGNLYFCHNTHTVVGTVRDSFGPYLRRVMQHDPTRENSRVCKDCPVVALCACGCPLIGPDVRAATYCKLKRAMLQPFVDLVLRLGAGESA